MSAHARPIRAFLYGVVFVLLFIACTSAEAASGSGVRGIALLGPTCPVEQANHPCPLRPLAGVRVSIGRHRVTTDADGRFRIGLTPSRYTLTATNPHNLDRGPKTLTVTVRRGRFTSVTLRFDSGIR